jgi:glycosyltransferase involved in cell wall biosynthesis
MPIGGAETLLVNLVRGLDRDRVVPEICCLKEPGTLGNVLAESIPLHSQLLRHKFDIAVLGRLCRLFRRQRYDAVVTVGAGDKMFWGRLAARRVGLPVVVSALHSTGWPDVVTRLNRLLTPITDAFVGVAASHGRFLIEKERFPEHKVHVIPNGVDTERFRPSESLRSATRAALGIPADARVVGVVAALRPEKNLKLFIDAAREFARHRQDTRFVIVGDGPERAGLEDHARDLGERLVFLGSRSDVERILPAFDLFTLTSRMEASPVSILEALACGVPVVATDVGSVAESVIRDRTGLVVPVNDVPAIVAAWRELLGEATTEPPPRLRESARRFVESNASLRNMVQGYACLLESIYDSKCSVPRRFEEKNRHFSLITTRNHET